MIQPFRNRNFVRYAWGVLAYNVFIILTGAYVRATGSGAGCGNHWPTCKGQVIPLAPELETVIEFTHRLTTAVALPLVLALVIWAFRAYPPGNATRKAAVASTVFIIVEALIGAFLVRRELVAENASAARALVIALHLANTYLLLAALALTAWWGSGRQPFGLRRRAGLVVALAIGLVGLIIVGMFGAVTALGDTLFPTATLAEGIRQDLDPTSHFLLRLRVWHPILAIGFSLYLVLLVGVTPAIQRDAGRRRLGQFVVGLVMIQLGAGTVNLLLQAPIPMQLIHLLLADAVWVVYVLLAAALLARPVSQASSAASQPVLHSANGKTAASAKPLLRQRR